MANDTFIGYACAYTPLALVHAFGFAPYRILPVGECPDQAGRLLHDNLCPHVKRILDRAMSKDLPNLSGMVFMNSCDAMRRLFDAWQSVCPEVESILIDLPTTASETDITFFGEELQRLSGFLQKLSGSNPEPGQLAQSIRFYNQLAGSFDRLRKKVAAGKIRHGAKTLQEMYIKASTTPPEAVLMELDDMVSTPDEGSDNDGVPVYLFGNMMPEIEAFSLFAACGARIMGEDLCSGSRLFHPIAMPDDRSDHLMRTYAEGILNRPPCARTMTVSQPGKLAQDVVDAVKAHQVRGVIGYTIKFCDPYIARLPGIRAALKKEDIPFLMLEGDCTVRSIGQQKTRIEAFIEMLR